MKYCIALDGGECNTDYKLLRMKLTVGRKLFKCRSSDGSCKRFDVAQLHLNNKENNSNGVSAREQFIQFYCN